jgi:hypothetical protein
MGDFRTRVFAPQLVDLMLLVAALKTGFLLSPGDRPELAMIGAAVIVQLFIGPRGERFLGNALASGTVIFLLYALYWSRGRDAWPLLPWLLALPVWRSLTGRTVAFPAWLMRTERQTTTLVKARVPWIGQRLVAGWRAAARTWQLAMAWPGMRSVRVIGLGLAGVGLMWPYLTRGIVGAGDAQWYAKTVADYVEQMRAGFFPLWTAQSDYSFYGGIFPLRLAPYLAHLTGAVDLLTGRQLPPVAVMNVALVLSLVGGLMSMFLCLRVLMPARPWIAMGLALYYALCPGVLGLAYAQDLYMSFCTLPFLPVALLGAVQSFTRNDLGPRLLMAGGLAAAWLAHPPIALWCGIMLLASQLARLAITRTWRATWKYDAFAVGWFVLLAGYSFVSVQSLGPQPDTVIPASFHYARIREAFPRNWLPLDPLVRALDNLQLGYGLAALGLLVAIQARGPGLRVARLFLWGAAGLIVLLLPIPYFTEYLWRAMPQVVLNITNMWPMQRLLVLAAGCVLMASALWLGGIPANRAVPRAFQALLVFALAWGGLEAAKFIRRGHEIAGGWENARLQFRPENRTMGAASLGPVVVQPRSFNHGVTEVQLEHRFLGLDGSSIIRHATDAILPGAGPGAAPAPLHLRQTFVGERDRELPFWRLEPRLLLQPGKRYLLVFEFLGHDYRGTLKMEGKDFMRVYGLPEAGNEHAFGTKPGNARWLALWQTTGQPEEISLLWIPANPAGWRESGQAFANFELREYDPAKLDVVLESLLPYRAAVNAPAASYLETPRLYIPGYRALVDGRPVEAGKSPDGFVMVKLEPGRHTLELRNTAQWPVRVAYWAGLAGWLGFLVVAARYFRRGNAQWRAS